MAAGGRIKENCEKSGCVEAAIKENERKPAAKVEDRRDNDIKDRNSYSHFHSNELALTGLCLDPFSLWSVDDSTDNRVVFRLLLVTF